MLFRCQFMIRIGSPIVKKQRLPVQFVSSSNVIPLPLYVKMYIYHRLSMLYITKLLTKVPDSSTSLSSILQPR